MMASKMRLLLAVGLAFVLAAVCHSARGQTTPAKTQPKDTAKKTDWALPKGTAKGTIDSGSLCITADRRYAIFGMEKGTVSLNGKKTPLVILDLKTGKAGNLGDLLPGKLDSKIGRVVVRSCPQGRHILVDVGARRPQQSATYVVDLSTRKGVMIAQGGSITGYWAGDQIILSKEGKNDAIPPLEVYAATGKKLKTLKIRGSILGTGADKAGTLLLVVCHKDDPTKAISPYDAANAAIMVLRPDGTVVKKLGGVPKFAGPPVLSPSGRFAASLSSARWSPKVHIVSIGRGNQETHKATGEYLPIAVTDAGNAVTFPVTGGPINLYVPGGKSHTLVKDARAATVAGDELFYITAGDAPKLKAISLTKKKPS